MQRNSLFLEQKTRVSFLGDVLWVPPWGNEHPWQQTSRLLHAHVRPGMENKLRTKCFVSDLHTRADDETQLERALSHWGGVDQQLKLRVSEGPVLCSIFFLLLGDEG